MSGVSESGVGIRGTAFDATQPGVLAQNRAVDGIGLEVVGRTAFSAGGIWTVPKRATAATVKTTAVRATSVVLVTLTTNVGPCYVRWVELHADGFTVHLSARTTKSGTFNWLVLN